MKFTFTPNEKLPEVIIIEGERFNDKRGFFGESFRAKDFEENGIPRFVQENHSYSTPYCFRGLHYQLAPKAQGKLVYCIEGFIEDYVVDIRKNSPTFGEWIEIELNINTPRMVYIPEGYAHGFYVRSMFHNAHVVYKTTEYYSQEHDRSINPYDPKINLPIAKNARLSDKDLNAPFLAEADNNF